MSTLLAMVDQILGPDGLAVKTVEGFCYSEAQHHYARHAAIGFDAYDEKRKRASINAIEGATGTGKTLGYLIPLMLYAATTGERVAVSTCTRYLQRQILQQDAVLAQTLVAKVTQKTLSVARRIGLTSYVSVSACELLIDALLEDDDHDTDVVAFLGELVGWVEDEHGGIRINSGVLDDFMVEAGYEALPGALTARAVCLDRDADDNDELAAYHRDVAISKHADVLIANHALFALNAYRFSAILDDDRPIAVVVFDEADSVPQVACDLLAAEISIFNTQSLLEEAGESLGITAIAKRGVQLYKTVMEMKTPTSSLARIDKEGAAAKAVIGLAKALRKQTNVYLDEFTENPKAFKKSKHAALKLSLIDLSNDIATISHGLGARGEKVTLISWSPVKEYPRLHAGRCDAGRIMNRYWAEKDWDDEDQQLPPRSYVKSVLFTSATISTAGKEIPQAFDNFLLSVGARRLDYDGGKIPAHNVAVDGMAIFEPSKFGTMRFVLADPRAHKPAISLDGGETIITSKEWLEYLATMTQTAHAAGGRTLVLTTSFDDAESVSALLENAGLDVITHRRGTKLDSLLAPFKEGKKSILITPAGWEGLDMPGLIKQMVIARIPFMSPDSTEMRLLQIKLKNLGYSDDVVFGILFEKMLIVAKRRLKQGLGRPIRSHKDKATVWIADPRFPLPESILHSMDPLVMAVPGRRTHRSVAACIPRRFQKAYQASSICLLDGSLHEPVQ